MLSFHSTDKLVFHFELLAVETIPSKSCHALWVFHIFNHINELLICQKVEPAVKWSFSLQKSFQSDVNLLQLGFTFW